MATTLDILVIPTYDATKIAILDNSVYDPAAVNPSLEITMSSFDPVTLTFTPSAYNVYNSTDLGLTTGTDYIDLPDGVYTIVYSANSLSVTKNIMRVDKLQEKFDEVFMTLDMMECDGAIKKQAKVNLSSVYLFIQGAIAAANNCALEEANKLYIQAAKMLNSYLRNNCGCSDNNYVVNF